MAPVQGVDGQVKPCQTTEIEKFPKSKWNEEPIFRESGFQVSHTGLSTYRKKTSSYHDLNV